MPLTTQQKCLGGVMLLAAAAFVYDQATSGKPAAAPEAAAASDLLVTQPASTPAPAARSVATTAPTSRLGAKLAEAAAAGQVDPLRATDAFLVPPTWPSARRLAAETAPARAAATKPAGPSREELQRALTEEFTQKHHLDAVMARPNAGFAIINGQGLRVGRTLDHFKLVAVTSTTATFERGDVRIELRLDTNSTLRLDGGTIESRSVANTQE